MDGDIDLIFDTAEEKFVCSHENDFFGSNIKSRDLANILKKSTIFKTKIFVKILKIFAEKFKINDRKILNFSFFSFSRKSKCIFNSTILNLISLFEAYSAQRLNWSYSGTSRWPSWTRAQQSFGEWGPSLQMWIGVPNATLQLRQK